MGEHWHHLWIVLACCFGSTIGILAVAWWGERGNATDGDAYIVPKGDAFA